MKISDNTAEEMILRRLSILQHHFSGWPLSKKCEIPWHFPDGSWRSSVALGMLSITYIMPVLVLNTCMDTNMQFTINQF